VRGFTDQPVPRDVLERVLSATAWSRSGSNIQPWNIYVVTGAQLAERLVSVLKPGEAEQLMDLLTRFAPHAEV